MTNSWEALQSSVNIHYIILKENIFPIAVTNFKVFWTSSNSILKLARKRWHRINSTLVLRLKIHWPPSIYLKFMLKKQCYDLKPYLHLMVSLPPSNTAFFPQRLGSSMIRMPLGPYSKMWLPDLLVLMLSTSRDKISPGKSFWNQHIHCKTKKVNLLLHESGMCDLNFWNLQLHASGFLLKNPTEITLLYAKYLIFSN